MFSLFQLSTGLAVVLMISTAFCPNIASAETYGKNSKNYKVGSILATPQGYYRANYPNKQYYQYKNPNHPQFRNYYYYPGKYHLITPPRKYLVKHPKWRKNKGPYQYYQVYDQRCVVYRLGRAYYGYYGPGKGCRLD